MSLSSSQQPKTHRVGIKDLKNRLSFYLKKVKAGQVISITDHGQTIARISQAGEEGNDLQKRIQKIVKNGFLSLPPKSRKNSAYKPVVGIKRTGQSVADMIVEDRR